MKLVRAEPSSRFTALFERLAIDWLTAAGQKAVGERLALSWDEIHGIMERAVERGLERRQAEKLPAVGVDEKAFRKDKSISRWSLMKAASLAPAVSLRRRVFRAGEFSTGEVGKYRPALT